MDFKIGDRVRMIALEGYGRTGCYEEYGYHVDIGDTATIVDIKLDDESYALPYVLEFDDFMNGHRCGGLVPSGNGLYVNSDVIELVMMTPRQQIKRELLEVKKDV